MSIILLLFIKIISPGFSDPGMEPDINLATISKFQDELERRYRVRPRDAVIVRYFTQGPKRSTVQKLTFPEEGWRIFSKD